MPAVTVPDLLALPRVPAPDAATTRTRAVRSITTAPRGFEGEGFPVRRAFAGVTMEDLDPFVHLDQMGEVEYAPGEPKGTSWHPHRGFETVTYMLDGALEHGDSHGGGGMITDGKTQWMTAGSGVLHIEAPPEEVVLKGGLFHGFQLWVNLPRARKWEEPRYQDLERDAVTLLTSPDGGALLRLIAGDVAGHAGPGSTYTPMAMIHATLEPGARLRLPWRPDFNALVYDLAGRGTVGPEGRDRVGPEGRSRVGPEGRRRVGPEGRDRGGAERRDIELGQLAVLGGGDVIELAARDVQESRSEKLDVLILGGLPIREPVVHYGPFVMNTKAEVQQAMLDFQAGRLGSIPAARG